MSTVTITFGEQAENHVGMQKLGEKAQEGFSVQELKNAMEILFEKTECELIDLSIPEFKGEAVVLVIRNGVYLFTDREDLWNELTALPVDKKAKMWERVVSKTARHNLCFDDFDQNPEYELGKGTVVSWGRVPNLSCIRDELPQFLGEKARNLKAEGNYYYDSDKCGIGWHGDSERTRVVALRLGQSMPLYFRWYMKSEPISDRIRIDLNDGDMYVMSGKAVGTDWKSKNIPTLRHSTGAEKYVS